MRIGSFLVPRKDSHIKSLVATRYARATVLTFGEMRMKAKLRLSIGIAIGSGIGTSLYDMISKGANEVDIYRSVFTALFTFIVLLLVPERFMIKRQNESK